MNFNLDIQPSYLPEDESECSTQAGQEQPCILSVTQSHLSVAATPEDRKEILSFNKDALLTHCISLTGLLPPGHLGLVVNVKIRVYLRADLHELRVF